MMKLNAKTDSGTNTYINRLWNLKALTKKVAALSLGMNFPLKLIFCSDALKQMAVRKLSLFLRHLCIENDPFTKTGSEQT